jgi:hypothetical protein
MNSSFYLRLQTCFGRYKRHIQDTPLMAIKTVACKEK